MCSEKRVRKGILTEIVLTLNLSVTWGIEDKLSKKNRYSILPPHHRNLFGMHTLVSYVWVTGLLLSSYTSVALLGREMEERGEYLLILNLKFQERSAKEIKCWHFLFDLWRKMHAETYMRADETKWKCESDINITQRHSNENDIQTSSLGYSS